MIKYFWQQIHNIPHPLAPRSTHSLHPSWVSAAASKSSELSNLHTRQARTQTPRMHHPADKATDTGLGQERARLWACWLRPRWGSWLLACMRSRVFVLWCCCMGSARWERRCRWREDSAWMTQSCCQTWTGLHAKWQNQPCRWWV